MTFGRAIGLAFQLLDDVLDILGPAEADRQGARTDLLDGTVTLPFILARERDPGLLELDLRSIGPSDAAAICDRIAETGAPEEVRSQAREQVGAAKRELRASGIGGEELKMLELVADGVVERYS